MTAITLHPDAVERIRAHGASTYPNECCGALIGSSADGETRVLEQARIGIRRVLERVAGHTECGRRSSDRRATREHPRSRA